MGKPKITNNFEFDTINHRQIRWQDKKGVMHAIVGCHLSAFDTTRLLWTKCGEKDVPANAAWTGNDDVTCQACTLSATTKRSQPMTELKATRGKWIAVSSDPVENWSTWFVKPVAENTRCIAEITSHCSSAEMESSAHLIAASPELYEALHDLIFALEPAPNENMPNHLREPMKKAFAACAKARGEDNG